MMDEHTGDQVIQEFEFHEAAGMFRLMPKTRADAKDEDLMTLDELGEDIRRNGLRVPVHVYKGQVIDGRNRYLACKEYCPERFDYEEIGDSVVGEDPEMYVWSLNASRRHLNKSQLAAAAVEFGIVERFEKEAAKREKAGVAHPRVPGALGSSKGKSADAAAKAIGVGGKTVTDAKHAKKESPAVFQAIKDGDISAKAGREIIKANGTEQGRKQAVKDRKSKSKSKPLRRGSVTTPTEYGYSFYNIAFQGESRMQRLVKKAIGLGKVQEGKFWKALNLSGGDRQWFYDYCYEHPFLTFQPYADNLCDLTSTQNPETIEFCQELRVLFERYICDLENMPNAGHYQYDKSKRFCSQLKSMLATIPPSSPGQ